MTKNTMINILLFASGAAIGSLVTWKIMKDKCERDIQEEVAAFKKEWSERAEGNRVKYRSVPEDYVCEGSDSDEDEDEDAEYNPDQQTLFDYHNLAHAYSTSSDDAENVKKGEKDDTEVPYVNGPYVIHPNDYGDGNYDHELRCLTYYSDGILADDWDVKFDVEETIGTESLKHFGDYAEDVVHVRNERLECDYEVVRDPRRYSDVVRSSPSKYVSEN